MTKPITEKGKLTTYGKDIVLAALRTAQDNYDEFFNKDHFENDDDVPTIDEIDDICQSLLL